MNFFKSKNRIGEIFFAIVVVVLLSGIAAPFANAQIPIIGNENLELPSVESPTLDPANNQFADNPGMQILFFLVNRVLGLVLLFLQGAAVAYIVYIGTQMVLNVDNKDMIKEKRMALLYAILGFIVLSIGGEAIRIFDPTQVAQQGTDSLFITDPNAGLPGLIKNIINIIKYVIWAIAIVMLTIMGYKMISNQERDITKQRHHIFWIAIGLFFIQIADLVIQPFLPETENKVEAGNMLLVNIGNILLTIMAPTALFFIILGAYYYLSAAGDEGKTKKGQQILIGTVIAVVIAYSSYTIVAEALKYANM